MQLKDSLRYRIKKKIRSRVLEFLNLEKASGDIDLACSAIESNLDDINSLRKELDHIKKQQDLIRKSYINITKDVSLLANAIQEMVVGMIGSKSSLTKKSEADKDDEWLEAGLDDYLDYKTKKKKIIH